MTFTSFPIAIGWDEWCKTTSPHIWTTAETESLFNAFLSIQKEWMPLYTDLFFIVSFHNEAFIAHLFSMKAVSAVCVCVCACLRACVCVCVCVCRCACSSITAVCFVRAIITVCISLWRYCSLGWCTMCLISSSSKVRVLWRRFVEHESSTYYDNCFRIRI